MWAARVREGGSPVSLAVRFVARFGRGKAVCLLRSWLERPLARFARSKADGRSLRSCAPGDSRSYRASRDLAVSSLFSSPGSTIGPYEPTAGRSETIQSILNSILRQPAYFRRETWQKRWKSMRKVMIRNRLRRADFTHMFFKIHQCPPSEPNDASKAVLKSRKDAFLSP